MPQDFEQARSQFLAGVGDFEAGRYADAEAKFRLSLESLPGRPSTLANLGAALNAQGRHDEALAVLDQALRADPNNADALCHKGVALAAAGRNAEALAAYERALFLDDHRTGAWLQRGLLLNLLERHDEALAAFTRLVELDPRHGEGWVRRGQTLQSMLRDDEALPCYEKALEIDPTLTQAWTNRALLLKDLKRLDEAATCFEQAIAHGGDPKVNGYFLASIRGEASPAAPPENFVAALFDDYAETFDEHLVNVLKYRTHVILGDYVNAMKRRFASALDLGCGSGLCGPLVKPVVGRIVGVDVSANMLEKARARNVYADLVRGDIADYLHQTPERYDLVLAADVFVYIGELDRIFAGVRRVIEPDGIFCFSVEAAPDGERFVLLPSLRYAHSEPYVRELAANNGFAVDLLERRPLREDRHQPIMGLYVHLRRA